MKNMYIYVSRNFQYSLIITSEAGKIYLTIKKKVAHMEI